MLRRAAGAGRAFVNLSVGPCNLSACSNLSVANAGSGEPRGAGVVVFPNHTVGNSVHRGLGSVIGRAVLAGGIGLLLPGCICPPGIHADTDPHTPGTPTAKFW